MTETLHYPASVTRKSLDGILPSPRTLHIAEKMGSPLFITETGIVLSRVQSGEAMVQARHRSAPRLARPASAPQRSTPQRSAPTPAAVWTAPTPESSPAEQQTIIARRASAAAASWTKNFRILNAMAALDIRVNPVNRFKAVWLIG